MRFLITAAPDPNAEKPAGDAPVDEKLFAAYMKYNDDLARAGVLVASEGLSPSRQGARIGVADGKRVVLDGPFAESKELVGGFYLIDVKSREEAIAWALRSPCGMGSDDVLTLHPMTEASDIPPHLAQLIREVAPAFAALWERGR